VGEVDSCNFARHIEDGAEGLIVVALVEQLHFVGPTASCNNQILMLLAELTGVEQTGRVSNFDAVPIQGFI
jgi:hypothetical protein